MTSQSLSRYQNGAAVPYEPPVEDEFDLGLEPGEARPARLAWNSRDGQFTNPLTGEISDAVTMVVLTKLHDSRVYFNPNRNAPREERVLCRSYDMLTPEDPERAAACGAGPTCAECAYHDFSKDQYGKTVKPPCSPVLNLGIATEDEDPAALLFSVKSLSAKAMRQLLNTIENLRIGRKLPPFAYKVELRAGEKITEDNNAYFPLQARVLTDRVPEDLRAVYGNLWRMVRAYQPAAYVPESEDELEAADSEAAPAGGPQFVTPEKLQSQLDADEHIVFDEHGNPVETTAATASEEPMPQNAPSPPTSTGGTLPGLDVAERRVDPADARRGRR